ncbi:MAG: hypothetical protein HC788_06275, partial [Sphingopyxis sp.]|nr:hypothetical protein [Sphingopyxis sp.]
AGRDNAWILALDERSLKEDIEARLGVPVPRLLAAGIQGYCYSSFDAGWESISAAAAWNFLAAEEDRRTLIAGMRIGANLAGMQQNLGITQSFHIPPRLATRDSYTISSSSSPTRVPSGRNITNVAPRGPARRSGGACRIKFTAYRSLAPFREGSELGSGP